MCDHQKALLAHHDALYEAPFRDIRPHVRVLEERDLHGVGAVALDGVVVHKMLLPGCGSTGRLTLEVALRTLNEYNLYDGSNPIMGS